MRICTARCEIGAPARPGKTGASFAAFVSPRHASSAARACEPTGTLRCLLPLPSTVTSPLSRSRSRQRSAHSRSEEHTSELQSLMRTSYAVFCLKKKKQYKNGNDLTHTHTTAINTTVHHLHSTL